jgi:hypothetical protein
VDSGLQLPLNGGRGKQTTTVVDSLIAASLSLSLATYTDYLRQSPLRPRESCSLLSSSLEEDDVPLPLSSSAGIGDPQRWPYRKPYSMATQTMWRTHWAAYPQMQKRSGVEELSSWLSTSTTADTRINATFQKKSSVTTGWESSCSAAASRTSSEVPASLCARPGEHVIS